MTTFRGFFTRSTPSLPVSIPQPAAGVDDAMSAALHPAVALAVADWLEESAAIFDTDAQFAIKVAFTEHALAVATAYLGTP